MKREILVLPKATQVCLDDFVKTMAKVDAEDPIAVLLAGDEHYGTKEHDNNSKLLRRVFQTVRHRLVGSIGDMVHDPRRTDRLNSDDWRTLQHHRDKDLVGEHLPLITGNHDHSLYARPEKGSRRPRGDSEYDFLWLKKPRLLEEVVWGIAQSRVYYGPSAVGLGLISDDSLHLQEHPGFFDVMIILIGRKLFLLRHGDRWDGWYKRDDDEAGRKMVKDKLKRQMANIGSGIYDFLASIDGTGSVKAAKNGGVAKIIKRYFNAYRQVCTDVARGSTRELLDLTAPWKDRLDEREITYGGAICGHTHLATRIEVNGVEHINLGDCRGKMIGITVITESGVVHGPYEVREQ